MGDTMDKVATIAVAIIGVATLAVIVSKKAQTPQVITSAGKAFSSALAVAVSPVTGGGSASFDATGIGTPSFGF